MGFGSVKCPQTLYLRQKKYLAEQGIETAYITPEVKRTYSHFE
ncbi:hypothetical protein J2Y37_001101 [Prolinoborus sp. 3657]|nr:hypothetical protein [Prolinoborus sp. 3657]